MNRLISEYFRQIGNYSLNVYHGEQTNYESWDNYLGGMTFLDGVGVCPTAVL